MIVMLKSLYLLALRLNHRCISMVGMLMLAVLLSACATLPPAEPVTEPVVRVTETNNELAQVVSALRANRDNLTGIYPLSDSHDSFAARASLIQAAEHTLDLQYYIWHNDVAGQLLAHALMQAADRGVKVRLLLDDNNTNGLDALMLRLDAHPNIQVRLFNPFVNRKFRFMGYLTEFKRLNRRMHNKAFIVDQQAAILGGRNIGDEYFGNGDGVMFMDLDVLAVGEVTEDVSADFERYWRSPSSYALAQILGEKKVHTPKEKLSPEARNKRQEDRATYLQKIKESDFASELQQQRLPLQWSKAKLVSDDPAKALGSNRKIERHIVDELSQALGEPKQSFLIVSPYFVPTKTGTHELIQLANSGIDITILTNSLAATDVAPVHSGYAKYRKPLLRAGINLYELKPTVNKPVIFKDRGLTGSSGSSLHAKTIAVDNETLFIGSFNMDPRSANLNTENGVVIHNPELTRHFKQTLLSNVPINAYEVQLDDKQRLVWLEHSDSGVTVYHHEPKASWLKRTMVKFLSWLPLEPLL